MPRTIVGAMLTHAVLIKVIIVCFLGVHAESYCGTNHIAGIMKKKTS